MSLTSYLDLLIVSIHAYVRNKPSVTQILGKPIKVILLIISNIVNNKITIILASRFILNKLKQCLL